MKSKLIIFEGVDKTGKSTLINLFNKSNNYKYWVLDRGAISSLIYDIMFKRNNSMYWEETCKDLNTSFDLKIIYCTASEKTIRERLKDANEELPKELDNISYVDSLFRYTLKRLKINYLHLDTDFLNKDDCIKAITQFIEEK